MAVFKPFKETAVPSTWEADAVYFIRPPSAPPQYVEIYVTDTTGTPFRAMNQSDIQALINASIASSDNITIVEDIAERNALAFTSTRYVYVKDATGDTTVTSGGATYLYNPDATPGQEWIKVSESESMDVQLTWANIIGKPTSTPAQIDTAVSNSHTHSNKTQLDKISEDLSGNLLYNGSLPTTGWVTTDW